MPEQLSHIPEEELQKNESIHITAPESFDASTGSEKTNQSPEEEKRLESQQRMTRKEAKQLNNIEQKYAKFLKPAGKALAGMLLFIALAGAGSAPVRANEYLNAAANRSYEAWSAFIDKNVSDRKIPRNISIEYFGIVKDIDDKIIEFKVNRSRKYDETILQQNRELDDLKYEFNNRERELEHREEQERQTIKSRGGVSRAEADHFTSNYKQSYDDLGYQYKNQKESMLRKHKKTLEDFDINTKIARENIILDYNRQVKNLKYNYELQGMRNQVDMLNDIDRSVGDLLKDGWRITTDSIHK